MSLNGRVLRVLLAGAAFGLAFGIVQSVFGTLKRDFLATVLVEGAIFAAVVGGAWVVIGFVDRFTNRSAKPS